MTFLTTLYNFRVKNGYEEANVQLDDVRRENKSLSDEIKDLMEQISEGGRSIHEIEKQRKKLEQEKFELETALGDAESALEQEENKLLRLSLEVNQVRADIGKPKKYRTGSCYKYWLILRCKKASISDCI